MSATLEASLEPKRHAVHTSDGEAYHGVQRALREDVGEGTEGGCRGEGEDAKRETCVAEEGMELCG
jgi:hypothetical protein